MLPYGTSLIRVERIKTLTLFASVPTQAHHAVMVHAMKAKQTVDVAQCDALEHAVGDFAKMYTKE
jgi:hypothetical protein